MHRALVLGNKKEKEKTELSLFFILGQWPDTMKSSGLQLISSFLPHVRIPRHCRYSVQPVHEPQQEISEICLFFFSPFSRLPIQKTRTGQQRDNVTLNFDGPNKGRSPDTQSARVSSVEMAPKRAHEICTYRRGSYCIDSVCVFPQYVTKSQPSGDQRN